MAVPITECEAFYMRSRLVTLLQRVKHQMPCPLSPMQIHEASYLPDDYATLVHMHAKYPHVIRQSSRRERGNVCGTLTDIAFEKQPPFCLGDTRYLPGADEKTKAEFVAWLMRAKNFNEVKAAFLKTLHRYLGIHRADYRHSNYGHWGKIFHPTKGVIAQYTPWLLTFAEDPEVFRKDLPKRQPKRHKEYVEFRDALYVYKKLITGALVLPENNADPAVWPAG